MQCSVMSGGLRTSYGMASIAVLMQQTSYETLAASC